MILIWLFYFHGPFWGELEKGKLETEWIRGKQCASTLAKIMVEFWFTSCRPSRTRDLCVMHLCCLFVFILAVSRSHKTYTRPRSYKTSRNRNWGGRCAKVFKIVFLWKRNTGNVQQKHSCHQQSIATNNIRLNEKQRKKPKMYIYKNLYHKNM